MVTSRGKSGVKAYFANAPKKLTNVLRGAARAGGKVFQDYIEENTPSDDVRQGLRRRTTIEGDQIKVVVDLKPGWARSVGNWLEYGTDGHFISVDDGVRKGRSVGRINQQLREPDANASLVIGGNFVGRTVWHPGAQPHPTFRPARDLKAAEAIAEAQSYINTRVRRGVITMPDEGDDA